MGRLHFDTLQVHAGFRSALRPELNCTQVVADRLAQLEGGSSARLYATELAAYEELMHVIPRDRPNLLFVGEVGSQLYSLAAKAISARGGELHVVRTDSLEDASDTLRQSCGAILVESIQEPLWRVSELESLSRLAQLHEARFVVDNTYGAAGYLCRPLEHGADIVVSRASEWLFTGSSGIRATVITKRSEGDEFEELADGAAQVDARPGVPADALPYLSTLSLRAQRAAATTAAVADYLGSHHLVAGVAYPGNTASATYANARRYLRHGFGTVLSLQLKPHAVPAQQVCEALRLFEDQWRIGATTSSARMLNGPGIESGGRDSAGDWLQLSFGIEYVDDLVADLTQGLMGR